jgi:hypothetical protein
VTVLRGEPYSLGFMSEAHVHARAVRWVGDEPFPGVVEVELTDADGRDWSFRDKSPVFDRKGLLGSSARYPVNISIACTVLERTEDRVVISTAEPWGVESVERESRFVMRPDQVTDVAP